jgi:hypothetical protein
VNAIAYKRVTVGTDRIFIGGDLKITNPQKCSHICEYNYKDESFRALGQYSIPDQNVHSIGLNGDDIYAGGQFDINGGPRYIAKLEKGSVTWKVIGNDRDHITSPVINLFVCDSSTLGCKAGSVGVAGDDRLLKFFDGTEWKDFGKGLYDGNVFYVTAFSSGAQVYLSMSVILLALLFLFS